MQQAFGQFEGADMTPVPWGDEGPSTCKRPASVALDDEEKKLKIRKNLQPRPVR